MRLKLYLVLQFLLIIAIETTFGTERNKTKPIVKVYKKHINLKEKNLREKRSFDTNIIPIAPQRGRSVSITDDADKEPPFWGSRGRRDSSSLEDYTDDDLTFAIKCKDCYKLPLKNTNTDRYLKERRQDLAIPFWGNRGRRNTEEFDDVDYPFWGNRGRRQNEDPFWGARGRRQQEEVPFWGSRGRRHSQDEQDKYEDPPFWGNRGRREETDPFWGSRGRRDNKYGRKQNIIKLLRNIFNGNEYNKGNIIIKRDNSDLKSFWSGRSRNSQLSDFFKNSHNRFQHRMNLGNLKPSESKTILDDRFYAEQPHYILVERSSRSSAEDDPFFISRGKKKVLHRGFSESNRNRRGAFEELVKSVRNDPYYIARGKKDVEDFEKRNLTNSGTELEKAKDLICATIDFILYKNDRVKREVDDTDRDRRTILKKLAAQLQADPYFVSRGKKNKSLSNDANLKEFMNKVSVQCN